jgi:hypothetical protein
MDVIVKINTNQKRKRCQQGAKQRINNSLNTRRIIPQPKIKKKLGLEQSALKEDIQRSNHSTSEIQHKNNNKNRGKNITENGLSS